MDVTPEMMDAIVGLLLAITAVMSTWSVKQNSAAAKMQNDWKAQEQTVTAPVVVVGDSPGWSETAVEALNKAIPAGADILKIDEGVASNGSKYRIVYWRIKSP